MEGHGCGATAVYCGPIAGCLGPYDSLFNVLCCFLCPEYMWLLNKETQAQAPGAGRGCPHSSAQCRAMGPHSDRRGCAAALEPSPRLGDATSRNRAQPRMLCTPFNGDPCPPPTDSLGRGRVGGDQGGNREREEVNTWAGGSDLGAGRGWILHSHRGQPLGRAQGSSGTYWWIQSR